jgi:hypothetical protein
MRFNVLERATFNRVGRVSRDPKTNAVVLAGVKYLGSKSSNVDGAGRFNAYSLESRRRSEHLFRGASVFLDHPSRDNPNRERSYGEKLGRLRGPFRHAKDGSYATLVLNPATALADQIEWSAAHSPDSLGLSINAQGEGVTEGKSGARNISITRVRSVDLVAAAATTSSLFESKLTAAKTKPSKPKRNQSKDDAWLISASDNPARTRCVLENRREIESRSAEGFKKWLRS